MHPRTLPLLVVAAALAAGCASRAEPAVETAAAPSPVESAAVQASPATPGIAAALDVAKGNRRQLELALEYFEALGDADELAAARFLVENLPGKGYVVFEWHDAKGETVPFEALDYASFTDAQAALERIEKERGELNYRRARFVPDVETITADHLIRHVERSVAIWRAVPAAERPSFEVFREFVLPHRGSDEPLEDWLTPLAARIEEIRATLPPGASRRDLWNAAMKDMWNRVRFDEIYYLHPTDQSRSEIEATKMGRCEDLSNLTTFYARAMCWPTACDYTPAWGHRDNNHAWTVDLDAQGRGSDKGQAHAAKIYRKTFAPNDGAPCAKLPPGREAPNRWLANRCQIDVTDQYTETTNASVVRHGPVSPGAAPYACVFNGGEWIAIAAGSFVSGGKREIGGEVVDEELALFPRLGRNLVYLPVTHDGKTQAPLDAPFIASKSGEIVPLSGNGAEVECVVAATMPEQVSADTGAKTPVQHLEPGKSYTLFVWRGGWEVVEEFVAGADARTFRGLPAGRLFWLVEKGGRKLERIFTIEGGRQRFW